MGLALLFLFWALLHVPRSCRPKFGLQSDVAASSHMGPGPLEALHGSANLGAKPTPKAYQVPPLSSSDGQPNGPSPRDAVLSSEPIKIKLQAEFEEGEAGQAFF
ncbi:hypothetical protein LINPERPRIM_LOCUS11094, partial [Linum perenne]